MLVSELHIELDYLEDRATPYCTLVATSESSLSLFVRKQSHLCDVIRTIYFHLEACDFFQGCSGRGLAQNLTAPALELNLRKDTLRPCSPLQPHMNHQSGNENLPESSEIDGFEDVGTILKAGELLSLEVVDVPSTSCQAHPTADKPDIYNPSKSNGYGNFTISYF